MKSDSTVLRSKFARRIVALLVIAALIPIAVTAVAVAQLRRTRRRSAGLRRFFVPATAVALLVVALLSIRGVRRMLSPLEKLIDGTRRAGNQDFSARLGDDELGELATSFNSMASRLGRQFSALVTLAEIDDAILSRHELDRVVDTAVLRMREIVPADVVGIAIVDRNAPEKMRVVARDQAGNGPLEHAFTSHTAADAAALATQPDGRWIERAHDASSVSRADGEAGRLVDAGAPDRFAERVRRRRHARLQRRSRADRRRARAREDARRPRRRGLRDGGKG